MNKPDDAPDRIELFSRCREKMVAELDSILESTLPLLANDIETAAQQRKLSMDEQRQLYQAAAGLRMELRARVASAHAAFNERALRCLEVSIQDASEKKALSLLQEEELEVQILAADVAALLREDHPNDCLSFAKRIEYLTQGHWPIEDMQPLGPRTLGSAVGASLKALTSGGSTKLTIKTLAVSRLKQPLGRLIVQMNEDLIRQRVLPDWKSEIQKQESAAEPEAMKDLPLPAVWQPAQPQAQPQSEPIAQPQPESIAKPKEQPKAQPARPADAPAPPLAATPVAAAAPLPEQPPVATNKPAPIPEIKPEFRPEAKAEPKAGQESATTLPPASNEAEPVDGARPKHSINISEMASNVSRKLDRSPLAAIETANKLRTLPVLQPVLDIERDAVAFAHSIGVVPYSRESRREFFKNVRDRLKNGAGTPAQVATVEVVGAMFDYVVDDRRLPEPAKPLFWRLQQPTVALSLLDPGYLSNEQRSLRGLIENFGAIATAYSDEFVKGGELHRRFETVVRAVEIVSSALQVRSAVISSQVDREYGRAVRNVTKLVDRVANERTTLESTPSRQNRRDYRRRPDKQREIEVSDKLRLMLEERISKHKIPESAKEFILTVWLRHLRTAVLRDGEESTEFKLALEVVDDLLWSMETGVRKQSRRALAKRIPPLIRMLTSGLKEIGAREEEHKSFFDELFLLHLRKMRRDSPASEDTGEFSELSPLTSLPTLRDEIESRTDNVLPPDTAGSAAKRRPAPSKQSGSTPVVPSFVPPFTTIIGNDTAAQSTSTGAQKPRVSRAPSARNRPGFDASANVLSTPSINPFQPKPPETTTAPTQWPELIPETIRKSPTQASADAPAHSPAKTAANGSANPPVNPSANPPMANASGAVTGAAPREETADDRGPEQKLLEVLNSLDLDDPPQTLNRREISIEQLVETVDRGLWLALVGNDGVTSIAKIAWVNSRRTVILLVRHPDRRALSLRMDELKRRAGSGRAYLIQA